MLEVMHVSPKEFSKGKMKLPLYRALYLDKMLEQCSGIYTDRDSHFKKLIKNFKTVRTPIMRFPDPALCHAQISEAWIPVAPHIGEQRFRRDSGG